MPQNPLWLLDYYIKHSYKKTKQNKKHESIPEQYGLLTFLSIQEKFPEFPLHTLKQSQN